MTDLERFDNSKLTCFAQDCEFKYFLRYENNIVPANLREMALEFGKRAHSMCDKMFAGESLDKALEVWGSFEDAVDEESGKLLDERRTKRAGELLAKEYYATWENSPFEEVLSIEQWLEMNFKDFIFGGRIDKRVRWMFGVTPIDHKTTTGYLSEYFDDAAKKHQYTGYVTICKEHFEDSADSLLLDVMYVPKFLKTKEPQTDFKRVLTDRTAFQIAKWKKFVDATVHDIWRARERGIWRKFDNCCKSWNKKCPYMTTANRTGLCDLEMSNQEIVEFAKTSVDYKVEEWKPWEMEV